MQQQHQADELGPDELRVGQTEVAVRTRQPRVLDAFEVVALHGDGEHLRHDQFLGLVFARQQRGRIGFLNRNV